VDEDDVEQAARQPHPAHVALEILHIGIGAQDLAKSLLPALRDIDARESAAARREPLRQVTGGRPASAAVVEHTLVSPQVHPIHEASVERREQVVVESALQRDLHTARLRRHGRRAARPGHVTSPAACAPT